MTEDELLDLINDVRREELRAWIARGWLHPARERGEIVYREVDVARLRLIRDMRYELAVNEEGVAVALDLVDRLYGTRAQLQTLCDAVSRQPDTIRKEIARLVQEAIDR